MPKPEIWRGPVKSAEGIHWWVKCPDCGTTAMIDEDQAYGRISIQCDCGYHETHSLVG